MKFQDITRELTKLWGVAECEDYAYAKVDGFDVTLEAIDNGYIGIDVRTADVDIEDAGCNLGAFLDFWWSSDVMQAARVQRNAAERKRREEIVSFFNKGGGEAYVSKFIDCQIKRYRLSVDDRGQYKAECIKYTLTMPKGELEDWLKDGELL